MTSPLRLALLSLVLIAVGATLLVRDAHRTTPDVPPAGATAPHEVSPSGLPRLVELGSHGCASCQAMFPVLDALRAHYGRVLAVEFIDVWKTPERARPFGVRVIPTQVFLDPQGREVFRHEGFFTEAAVIAAFGRAGIALEAEAHTP